MIPPFPAWSHEGERGKRKAGVVVSKPMETRPRAPESAVGVASRPRYVRRGNWARCLLHCVNKQQSDGKGGKRTSKTVTPATHSRAQQALR